MREELSPDPEARAGGSAFRLTSHEVMRGLKTRDGRLVLRPSGAILFNTGLDCLFCAVVATFAFVAGGLWVVLAIGACAEAIEAILRLRLAVSAGPEEVIVKNRTRNHRVRITEIAQVRVDRVHWVFRQPAYLGHGSGFGWDWLIGVIETTDGRRIQCDALVSSPERKGAVDVNPTPAEAKIGALNRWLAATSRAKL